MADISKRTNSANNNTAEASRKAFANFSFSPSASVHNKPTQSQTDAVKFIHEKWRSAFSHDDHQYDLYDTTKPKFPNGKPASARTNGIPLLPDLRDFHFSRRTLACLLPYLVTLTCNREKPLWGDPRMKPVWWPKRVPFNNPATGGWHKGGVARNRAVQNEPLFDVLGACYEYYNQWERFGTETIENEGWTVMAGGDDFY